MAVLRSETMPVRASEDVVTVRQAVRRWAIELGFSLVDQTKIVTAASELARNTVINGGGGTIQLEALNDAHRRGLRLIFADEGPGITDVERAMRDGYTTGAGLGLGLGGAKRLVNDFAIDTEAGRGTRIAITRWK
jgi:serine/threonine-protein kinase RsbT